MTKTSFVQAGQNVRLTAPYDRTAGQGAKIGQLFGVASNDVLSGAVGQFEIEGVFDLTKATGAFVEGGLVYWDDTNKVATTVANGNLKIGVAVLGASDTIAGSSDATGRVRLDRAVAAKDWMSSTVAAAGGNLSTAGALVTGVNTVTAADDTKGVVLPGTANVFAAGGGVVVINTVTNKLLPVYPPLGHTINDGSASTALSMGNGTSATFFPGNATNWYTVPKVPS